MKDQESLLEFWAGQGRWPGKEKLLHMKNKALAVASSWPPAAEKLARGEVSSKEASHKIAVNKAHGILIQHAQTGTYTLRCVTKYGSFYAWEAAVQEWLAAHGEEI